MGKAPALAGVAWDGRFKQVVFSAGLQKVQPAESLEFQDGHLFMKQLVQLAQTEGRKIVAFSTHEREVAAALLGVDLGPTYVNANLLARAWYRRTYGHSQERPGGLKDYLKCIAYPRQAFLGERQTTQRLRAVEDMLARRGEFGLLTPVVKSKWSKVLQHNRIDVLGMRALVLAASGVFLPAATRPEAAPQQEHCW